MSIQIVPGTDVDIIVELLNITTMPSNAVMAFTTRHSENILPPKTVTSAETLFGQIYLQNSSYFAKFKITKLESSAFLAEVQNGWAYYSITILDSANKIVSIVPIGKLEIVELSYTVPEVKVIFINSVCTMTVVTNFQVV